MTPPNPLRSLTVTVAYLIASLYLFCLSLAYSAERLNIASDGNEAEQSATGNWNSLSDDGRFAVFSSAAGNLVAGDGNGVADVFVRDRRNGATSRVSVASDGTQANGPSDAAVISGDGRYVAFESQAGNLVAGDSNGVSDVFVHDRQMGQTWRVSVASDGRQGNGPSLRPDLSADGRYVAFESQANNLVPGAPYWGGIYVHDRQTGQTTLESVNSAGVAAAFAYVATLSDDGRYVAFTAGNFNEWGFPGLTAINNVYVRDRNAGITWLAGRSSDGTPANADNGPGTLSGDGRYVAFITAATNLVAGDSNGLSDVFVHDRVSGATTRVSVASDGSEADGPSPTPPHLSGDGRYIVFDSQAANLVADDVNGVSDVFLHDRQSGATRRISVAGDGTAGNGPSWGAGISGDGRVVLYGSAADNLVAGDGNGVVDVFVQVQAPPDTLPPRIAVTSPALTNLAAYTLSGFLSETATLIVNGQTVAVAPDLSFQQALTLTEGANTLQVVATDGAGNSALLDFTVTLDSIPPAAPDGGLIQVGTPDAAGQVSISGGAGSVEGNATVMVTNLRTGETATVSADNGGGFSVQIDAWLWDRLSLVVTDRAGNTSDALVAAVEGVLSVTITSPLEGTVLDSSAALVTGTFLGPPNTGITVNGVVALSYGNQFYANNMPLSPGDNRLEVTAMTLTGETAATSVTVSATGASPMEVTAEPQTGIAPLAATFSIVNNGALDIQQISADFDGDGNVDLTTTDPNAVINHSYSAAGAYHAVITVADSQNTVYEQTLVIVVGDDQQLDQIFADIWNGLNEHLVQGDLDGASQYLNAAAQQKYRPVFEALLPYLPEIIASYSPLSRASISGDIGEYAITRTINGQNNLFLIYFLRDADGVWRLDAM
ncbi:MAG: hypothetical protein ACE5ET_05380 [Gammaproteobacteria bacterium]